MRDRLRSEVLPEPCASHVVQPGVKKREAGWHKVPQTERPYSRNPSISAEEPCHVISRGHFFLRDPRRMGSHSHSAHSCVLVDWLCSAVLMSASCKLKKPA